MFKKISYLKKIKSNKKVFYSYIKFWFLDKILKPFRLYSKYKNKKIIFSKRINFDWFTQHFFYFNFFLKKSSFSYLEIGAFEGNSFFLVLHNLKPKYAVAVDPWIDTQYEIVSDLSEVEKNFDYNLNEKKGSFVKIKKNSSEFFANNKKNFDVIYIDGSHLYEHVLQDGLNAWKILNINGFLIFDDFFFNYDGDYINSVGAAVNEFLLKIEKKYQIVLTTNNQIFIKKINN